MQLICSWDFGLTFLADPHRLEKNCLSKRPAKTAQQGLVWERGGVSPYPLGKTAHRPTQAVMQGAYP